MQEERPGKESNSVEAINASLDHLSKHAQLQTALLAKISKQMEAQGISRLVQFQSQSLLAIVSGYLVALGISAALGVWGLNQLSGWGQIAMAILLAGSTLFFLDRIFEIYGRVGRIVCYTNQLVEEMLSEELTKDEMEQLRQALKGETTSRKNWPRRLLWR